MSEHDDIMARLKTGIWRAKLATLPGQESDLRPALDELGSTVEIITQTLQHQATQLAALRAGADTEDLHAATVEAAASTTPIGWLYLNQDTGIEFSEQHPVESGEVPDAQDIREATAERLLYELKQAWAGLNEEAEAQAAEAEKWRKRAKAAEAKLNDTLPCDVQIPGATLLAGVKIEMLLLAISRREPGTKLPERKTAVSLDALAEARRQALEEAAQAVESGLDDIDGCGNSKDGTEAIALMVRTMRRRAVAIRALADRPAAGGADA